MSVGVFADMRCLPMPEANFILKADMAAMQLAPIYKKIEAISEENQKKSGAIEKAPLSPADLEELKKTLKECGVEDDDISSFLLAARVDDIALEDMKDFDPDTLDLVFGVTMKKALTMNNVEKIVKALVAKAGPEAANAEISRTKKDGFDILTLKDKVGPKATVKEKQPELHVALTDGGKTLIGGLGKSVVSALQRLKSGDKAKIGEDVATLRKSISPDNQFYMIFALSDAMKKMVKEKAAPPKAAPGQQPMMNPMMMGAQAFADIDHVIMAIKMDKNVTMNITAGFDVAQSAQSVNMLVNQALMMAKMSLPMNGVKPTTLAQTLKAEVPTNGKDVDISCVITSEDLDILKKFSESAGASPMMGAPAPADNAAAPAPSTAKSRKKATNVKAD